MQMSPVADVSTLHWLLGSVISVQVILLQAAPKVNTFQEANCFQAMVERVIGLPPLVYDHSRPTLECSSTSPQPTALFKTYPRLYGRCH